MSVEHIVFDIGGVLVDWQPHLAWMDDLGTQSAVEEFMERTEFRARNARADAGEHFADLAEEIEDETDRALFAGYVARYTRTIPDVIGGTWILLDRLRERGRPVHAITNWSAETWPEGLKVYPQLGSVFDTLVVSGQERLAKPDKRIFELLCARADVAAEACLFIDDGVHNVEGARAAGMEAVHFTTPQALETDLTERALL